MLLAFVSHIPLSSRPRTAPRNIAVPRTSPHIYDLPTRPNRSHLAPTAEQTPAQTTPTPQSKPRVTLLALLLLISTALWSLAILPIVLLMRFLKRKTSVIHLTRIALANALRTTGISVTVRHRENLPSTPCLVVANHQSPLDVFALACLNAPLISVLPARITSIPLIGWLIRFADWVFVKGVDRRSQMDSLKQIEQRLGNVSVAVFPEGIPSENGVVGNFAAPVFKAARKAGAQVVPITVHGGMKVGRMVPEKWAKYEVDVHPPMDIADMTDKEAAEEARRMVVSGLPGELRA